MVKKLWKLVSIKKSQRANKKLRATFLNLQSGNKIFSDFGQYGSQTFLDHKDDIKKRNYIKRHAPLEQKFWVDKTKFYSPSTLSVYLLWNKPTLKEAIKYYKTHFNIL